MLLADCHLFQSSGDLLPVVFEIQHDDILAEVDVIEICERLERADDICLRKFSFVAFEHLIKRDAGGQTGDIYEIFERKATVQWPSYLLVGQALSALGSTTCQHLTAVAIRHSFSKTVLLFSVELFRLICSQHPKPSFRV